MSPLVAQILQQIDQLSPVEQAEILQHLTHQVEILQPSTPEPIKHRASSFYGQAPNLLQGIDAQIWVSRGRNEWTERE
jgi:hypothetical protein